MTSFEASVGWFTFAVNQPFFFDLECECASSGATRLAAPILCAPAGPQPSRETAPCEGALSFFCWRPFASELAWVPTKKRLRLSSQPFLGLAERTRFELAVELPLRQFSKLLVSATHPPLRKLAESIFNSDCKGTAFFDTCKRFAQFFFKNHCFAYPKGFFLGF